MAGEDEVPEQSPLETTVDTMLATLTNLAAKVSDLTTQVAALKPLLPLVKQLDGLPDKVTKLQAAAFEGSNQFAALGVAVSRIEKTQHGGKAPATDGEDGSGTSAPEQPKAQPKSSSPLPEFRETLPLRRRPDDDDPADRRFH